MSCVVLSRQNQFAQSRTTAATHSALATCLEMETVFGARRIIAGRVRVEKERKEEEIMTRQLASVCSLSVGRERDALSLVVSQRSHLKMPACSEQSFAMSPTGMSFAPCPCDREEDADIADRRGNTTRMYASSRVSA